MSRVSREVYRNNNSVKSNTSTNFRVLEILKHHENAAYEMVRCPRNIDPELKAQYLSRWGESTPQLRQYKEFVKYLLDVTEYVPFERFFYLLRKTFNAFKEIIGTRHRFSVLIDCTKFGSELWILHLLYPMLKAMPNFTGLYSSSSNDKKKRSRSNVNAHRSSEFMTTSEQNDSILILDDCIYTGSQAVNLLRATDLLEPGGPERTIYSVCAFSSGSGLEVINSYIQRGGHSYMPFFGKEITPDLLTKKMLNLLNIDFKGPQLDTFEINKLGQEFTRPLGVVQIGYPIYFDHKCAGPFSSWPSIYLMGLYRDDNDKVGFFGPLMQVCPSRERIEFVKSIYQFHKFKKSVCIREEKSDDEDN